VQPKEIKAGSLVRQSGSPRGRIMRVLNVHRSKVVCEWTFGGQTYRDVFCNSGLRLVERGFIGAVAAAGTGQAA